jgi:hypothetical protein
MPRIETAIVRNAKARATVAIRCSPVPNALGSAWVMPAHSLISVRPHAPAARQLVEPAPRTGMKTNSSIRSKTKWRSSKMLARQRSTPTIARRPETPRQ